MQNPNGLRVGQGASLSGPGAAALKYDILTALLVLAAQGDPAASRLSMRLSLIITARYNWRRESFAVGQKEIARMWGVTERTAKREMAELRSRGWITLKIPAARGRVAEHQIAFDEVLRASLPFWHAIGPDYVARMSATPDPSSVSGSNVVPLHRPSVAAQEDDNSVWAKAAARLQSEDPVLFGAWFSGLRQVACDAGMVTLSAPSRFISDYVNTHHRTRLLAAVLADERSVRDILVVAPG